MLLLYARCVIMDSQAACAAQYCTENFMPFATDGGERPAQLWWAAIAAQLEIVLSRLPRSP